VDADVIDLIAAVAQHNGPTLRLASRPAVPGELPDVPRLLAGVAQVDLTPPPGLPKAGYSRNACTGTGFRTRLRATVVHLRHGRTSLAIVATDLLGGSGLVQHLVAAQIAGATDVPLAGLFLSATHTHGAPGQFHGTGFYNRFSSNRPGLDPAWTATLAGRIAAAVTEAVSTRQPAALAWGRTELTGLTRNRSLGAHRRNPGQALATPDTAINPDLNLLRVDTRAPDGGTQPLAALAFFSVHGTAVPMSSRTYNADLWAYLYAELGERLARTHGALTVAAVQGTHGDTTPALDGAAGHPEASRIGRAIGAAAAALYGTLDAAIASPQAGSQPLGSALREVDLASGPVVGGERLPRRPAVGAALLAGANENETPVICRIPPFRAGSGKPWAAGVAGAEQGAKWVVGSRWLQPLVLPLDSFPRVLPVHLVRVGEVLLTGLPMEITLAAGRRVAEGAGRAWAGESGTAAGSSVRCVVCSVVDEYAGYCTTEQEYAAQFYEGGHTLYGPGTVRFLGAVASDLAARLARGVDLHEALPGRHFSLAVSRYLPGSAGPSARSAGPGEVAVRRSLGVPSWGRAGIEDCLEWSWLDAAPGDLRWHEPMAALLRPDGSVVTDQHGDLEIEYLRGRRAGAGAGAGASAGHRYVVRWFPGAQETQVRRGYRFEVLPRSGAEPRGAQARPLRSPEC
jgi:neutral ceramidase